MCCQIRKKWHKMAIFFGVAFRYLGVGTGLLLASIVLFFAFEYGGVTSRQAILFALLAFVMASIAAWYGHQWIRHALWRPFFNMIGAALLFHFIVFAGVVPALSKIHVSSAIATQIAALPIKTVSDCSNRLPGTVIGFSAWTEFAASWGK